MIGRVRAYGGLLATLLTAACATPRAVDYAAFRLHHPRSILVLPPQNESTAVEATYGVLSTVTKPLAELGYYVYPVAVMDRFLKENGLPTAGEMHQVPLDKVREIVGADAILYITVQEYGTQYVLIDSVTTVRSRARLVDTGTGTTLWEGQGAAQERAGGSGNLIADAVAAVVTQIISTATDRAHQVSRIANANLLMIGDRGLLYGPYHPHYPGYDRQ